MADERCVKCFRPLEEGDEGPLCALCLGELNDGRVGDAEGS